MFLINELTCLRN